MSTFLGWYWTKCGTDDSRTHQRQTKDCWQNHRGTNSNLYNTSTGNWGMRGMDMTSKYNLFLLKLYNNVKMYNYKSILFLRIMNYFVLLLSFIFSSMYIVSI